MDILYFLKALLKRKWYIIIASVLAVVAAFFLTMNRPKLYVSNAQISTGLTVTDQVRLRDENVNMYEVDLKFDNITQTLGSPVVVGLLSYDLLIHDLTSSKPFRKLTEQELKSPIHSAMPREEVITLCTLKRDSLQMLSSYNAQERKVLELLKLYGYDYEGMKKQLFVGRLQRTDYIDIIFKSENPELSAYVVNTLYAEFSRYNYSLKSERTVENVEQFLPLVEQKKKELDQKVEALRLYRASVGLLNVEAASGNEMDLIKQFEKSLYDEKANLNNLNASLQNINNQLVAANAGKPAFIIDNRDILDLRTQINDLEKNGASDEATASKLKDLRSKLQAKLSASSTTPSKTISKEELAQKKGGLEAEINAANLNISNLETQLRRIRGSLGSYAGKDAMVSSLTQEVTLATEEYTSLKEKLNAALQNKTALHDTFRQTVKGQPAIKPESSKRLIIMGLSGVAVFFFMSFGILFMEFIDNSLKSPSIFERTVDLKLISTINYADLKKYSILEVLQNTIKNKEDVTKRENTFRELLRKLRFAVENSGKRIFLLTSTEPQQGKTTLTQALAYSLSLSNKKVLIIDTNFCNNDLTVQLQAKETLETFSIPPEQFSIDKIRDIVTTYETEGVEVIGCKGGDYTPSEILPKNNLLNYLKYLASYYDYILLEGAPLNDYTDSKELSGFVEGVIAVFSAKTSLKQIDKESIAFLHELGDKFVGAVLNGVREDYLEL